jgi:hypothetical protein
MTRRSLLAALAAAVVTPKAALAKLVSPKARPLTMSDLLPETNGNWVRGLGADDWHEAKIVAPPQWAGAYVHRMELYPDLFFLEHPPRHDGLRDASVLKLDELNVWAARHGWWVKRPFGWILPPPLSAHTPGN